MTEHNRGLVTAEQHKYLLNKLRSTRVASRKMPGTSRQMSYLESWDVRAHLTRIFGFGNYDLETIREQFLGGRDFTNKDNKPMTEVSWHVTMRLIIRDPQGREIARYSEGAVGSAFGGSEGAGLGDIHDNALKSAASDALKRCAINLGTQFGLSLYDNGNENDVVRSTLVVPQGVVEEEPDADAAAVLSEKLGAVEVTPTGEAGNEGHAPDPAQELAAQVADAPPSNGRPGSQHKAEREVGDRLEAERQERAGEENQDVKS